jgi:hypothetical protein
MTESPQVNFTPEELNQLRQFRTSVSDFKTMVASLPADYRSAEYNEQFNQLRLEAQALLKAGFTTQVPKAITGDITTDRSISMIVILGVILALTGLGVNSIVLEDVLVNSLGCCISGGGMLLVVGAFVVLSMKRIRQPVSNVEDLGQRCDLLLYQIDHRLNMVDAGSGEPVTEAEETSGLGQQPEQA